MNPMMHPERRAPALDGVRHLYATSLAMALALDECGHPQAAKLIEAHNRACALLRESDLVRPYRAPTVRVDGVQAGDWDAMVRHVVQSRRHLSNLRGAAACLLASIHRAGGWDVADRAHALTVGRSLEALETALQDALSHEDDLLSEAAA